MAIYVYDLIVSPLLAAVLDETEGSLISFVTRCHAPIALNYAQTQQQQCTEASFCLLLLTELH